MKKFKLFKKETINLLLLFSFSILLPLTMEATVIIPPQDIGELINSSDYVVYGEVLSHNNGDEYLNNFKTLDVIKGDITIGETILLQEYGGKIGDYTKVIDGDVNYKIGHKYLIFLFKNDLGYFKSNLLAFSIYENATINGNDLFAHTPELLNITVVGDVNPDFTGAYEKNNFLTHLHLIANGSVT